MLSSPAGASWRAAAALPYRDPGLGIAQFFNWMHTGVME
jgi:hypothetical protein